jgi:hypothetical protein
MNIPEIDSLWKHEKTGDSYIVKGFANMNSDKPDRYPPTIIYKGPDGRVWSAPLAEWHGRMTPRAMISPMCKMKTEMVQDQGYAKTGYVLRAVDESSNIHVCVSEGGAVTWFTKEEWTWLMHNRDHVEFQWPKPIGSLKK